MYKYFVILCSLLVLTACSGGPDTAALDQNQDGISQSDAFDRLGWGDVSGDDETVTEDETDDTYTGGTGGSDIVTTPNLILNVCYPSIPRNLNSAADVNCELTATGGSGTYEWSTQNLPDWLRLDEITNDKVVVTGRTPILDSADEPFNFKVIVRDAENSSRYKSKTYFGKVKAQNLMEVMIPVTSLSIRENLRIETDMRVNDDGMYNAPMSQLFDAQFKAVGGTAPYTWRFEGISFPPAVPTDGPPPPTIIDEDGNAVDVDGNDISMNFNSGDGEFLPISGMFEGDRADTYCKKRDGTLVPVTDAYVICKNDYGIGARRIYKTSLKVTATDSAGQTVSSEYEFELNSPRIDDETVGNIISIEAQLRAHDCGGSGCKAWIYLYGKDNVGIEHELGYSQSILISSSNWSTKTATVNFGITDSEHAKIKIKDITKVLVLIHDNGLCDYGEMWLDWFTVYSQYHYKFVDLQDHPIGGEVNWRYETYASKLLDDDWLSY